VSRRAVIAAAMATILIAGMTAAVAGRIAQGPPRVVYVVRTASARTVIKWRTRTVTVTSTVPQPFTVPCSQGASVPLIVGQEPAGATVSPMACTVTLNPDWGGLTVRAPDGLSVSLTGPAGGY
jgi:hypothetical protein